MVRGYFMKSFKWPLFDQFLPMENEGNKLLGHNCISTFPPPQKKTTLLSLSVMVFLPSLQQHTDPPMAQNENCENKKNALFLLVALATTTSSYYCQKKKPTL